MVSVSAARATIALPLFESDCLRENLRFQYRFESGNTGRSLRLQPQTFVERKQRRTSRGRDDVRVLHRGRGKTQGSQFAGGEKHLPIESHPAWRGHSWIGRIQDRLFSVESSCGESRMLARRTFLREWITNPSRRKALVFRHRDWGSRNERSRTENKRKQQNQEFSEWEPRIQNDSIDWS